MSEEPVAKPGTRTAAVANARRAIVNELDSISAAYHLTTMELLHILVTYELTVLRFSLPTEDPRVTETPEPEVTEDENGG